jgi:hypothetical protein
MSHIPEGKIAGSIKLGLIAFVVYSLGFFPLVIFGSIVLILFHLMKCGIYYYFLL